MVNVDDKASLGVGDQSALSFEFVCHWTPERYIRLLCRCFRNAVFRVIQNYLNA